MTNKQTRHLITILLILLLGATYPAALVRAQKPAAAKASPSGPQEGIKVHGRWTIDIRNPDGTLISRREFKNALTTSGGALLGRFLQRTHKPGEWKIQLGSPINFSPCRIDGWFQHNLCSMTETTSQFASSSIKSLTITSEGEPNINRTVFAGTVTANSNGSINSVATLLVGDCPVDTQGVCSSATFLDFTRTELATPIDVVAGQIIQVKVVISFS